MAYDGQDRGGMPEPRPDFGCGWSVTPLLSLLVVRQAVAQPCATPQAEGPAPQRCRRGAA